METIEQELRQHDIDPEHVTDRPASSGGQL